MMIAIRRCFRWWRVRRDAAFIPVGAEEAPDEDHQTDRPTPSGALRRRLGSSAAERALTTIPLASAGCYLLGQILVTAFYNKWGISAAEAGFAFEDYVLQAGLTLFSVGLGAVGGLAAADAAWRRFDLQRRLDLYAAQCFVAARRDVLALHAPLALPFAVVAALIGSFSFDFFSDGGWWTIWAFALPASAVAALVAVGIAVRSAFRAEVLAEQLSRLGKSPALSDELESMASAEQQVARRIRLRRAWRELRLLKPADVDAANSADLEAVRHGLRAGATGGLSAEAIDVRIAAVAFARSAPSRANGWSRHFVVQPPPAPPLDESTACAAYHGARRPWDSVGAGPSAQATRARHVALLPFIGAALTLSLLHVPIARSGIQQRVDRTDNRLSLSWALFPLGPVIRPVRVSSTTELPEEVSGHCVLNAGNSDGVLYLRAAGTTWQITADFVAVQIDFGC